MSFFDNLLWLRVFKIERKIEAMAVDLSVLTERINAQATVIEGITADYATMQAKIAELQEAIDPEEIQTQINELAEFVKASNDKLVALDEQVPPAIPSQPE